MNTVGIIEKSQNYMLQDNYNEALKLLNQCRFHDLDAVQKSQVYTLKGRCKYKIKDPPRNNVNVINKFARPPHLMGDYELIPTYSQQSKTHYNEALVFFDNALDFQPHYGEALFWKGKTLKALCKLKEAYICFAKSSKHGMNIKGRDLCIAMFNSESFLPFKKMRDWITDNELIKENLQKKNSYLKYEALKSIKKIGIQKLSNKLKKEFSNLIKPLCPNSFYCCTIAYTGDNDLRVKKLAMKIMKQLDEDEF